MKVLLITLALVSSLTATETTITQRPVAIKQFSDEQMAAIIDGAIDRKSTRLNSSHVSESRMPSSA